MATAVQKLRGEANRAEVVAKRLAGVTIDQIATQLGISESGVRYHVSKWVESIQPPAERAHELRETWGGRLEAAHEKVWPQVQEGDPKAIEVMLRIQAQFAKLFGLELQPGISVNIVTAEQFAAFLEWDAPAIEASGVVELEPGEPA